MKKNWYTLALVISFFYFFISGASASELNITCDAQKECQLTPDSTPLFSADQIVAGSSLTENLTFNNSSLVEGCLLKTKLLPTGQAEPLFSQALQLSITQAAYPQNVVSKKSIQDFFLETEYQPLFIANPQTTVVSRWELVFPKESGNIYQGKSTAFVAHFSITCDMAYRAPTPPPTPLPTPPQTVAPTLSPTPTASPQPTPKCHELLTAPIHFTYQRQKNKVYFQWKKVPEATGYLFSIYSKTTAKKFENIVLGDVDEWISSVLPQNEEHRVTVRAYSDCSQSPPAELIIPKEKSINENNLPSPDLLATQAGAVLGIQDVNVEKKEDIENTEYKYVFIALYISISASLLWLFFILLFRKKRKSS